ncbi:cyclase family protein [Candidatus Magnetominusculus xianensis]|nr:cyclase family protein [Candidatus Magnetominusculus xianensis]MBF0405281.1 cyclase family protein [Nitrospirota bacterium]
MNSRINNWIDISIENKNGMTVWPGDPEFSLKRIHEIDKGDILNLSLITMTSHTGTHMDAPLHWIRDGKSIDEMPISITAGPARVIEIKDHESIKVSELKDYGLKKGQRILFKTRNSHKDKFTEDFVYISVEAAELIVQTGALMVGIDALSVGGFHADGKLIHTTLLEAGVWIIEGLGLSQVEAGDYELICLPLKLTGCDGAPSRAIIRKLAE